MEGLIPQEVIDEVVRRLVAGLQPERIILFGSYAYGQPTPDSDLDLMVIVDHSDERPVQRDQRAYYHLQGVRVPVDVLVYTQDEVTREATVATSLPRTVADRGRVLYDRGETPTDPELGPEGGA